MECLKKLLKYIGGDIMFDCYNSKEHDCDGRCQGASDCIMARRKNKPSRKEMIKHMKDVEENQKVWNKLFDEIEKDEDFQNDIKKLYDELLN